MSDGILHQHKTISNDQFWLFHIRGFFSLCSYCFEVGGSLLEEGDVT